MFKGDSRIPSSNGRTAAGVFNSVTINGGSRVVYTLAQSFVAVSAPADTTEDTLATITIPPNTLGTNGALQIFAHFNMVGAGSKTFRVRFSGIGGTILSVQSGTAGDVTVTIIVGNKGVTNAQATLGLAAYAVVPTLADSSVDTTVSSTVVLTGQKVTAGDTATLKGYTVWVVR